MGARMNPVTNSMFGVQIVEVESMVDVVGEDWSRVRSPGRARRRRRKHPQNIRPLYAPQQQFVSVGNKIYCHPAMAAKLWAAAERKVA